MHSQDLSNIFGDDSPKPKKNMKKDPSRLSK